MTYTKLSKFSFSSSFAGKIKKVLLLRRRPILKSLFLRSSIYKISIVYFYTEDKYQNSSIELKEDP